MQSLPDSYLIELARQIAFLGAFLGGFAATFLATLLVVDSAKRIAGWIIGLAAAAACSFVVAVIAAVMLTTVLHPDVPLNVRDGASIGTARVITTLGFGAGVYALLASVGLSGWIRSRHTGIATSVISLVALILASWALGGFG